MLSFSFTVRSAKAELNKAKHAQKQHDQAIRQQLSPDARSGAWWNSLWADNLYFLQIQTLKRPIKHKIAPK